MKRTALGILFLLGLLSAALTTAHQAFARPRAAVDQQLQAGWTFVGTQTTKNYNWVLAIGVQEQNLLGFYPLKCTLRATHRKTKKKHTIRFRAVFEPQTNLVHGRVKMDNSRLPVRGDYSYTSIIPYFYVSISNTPFTAWLRLGNTDPRWYYYVFLLTNASNGLHIAQEKDIIGKDRCTFIGGGLCPSGQAVAYEELEGPFRSRSDANEALCRNIDAKKHFPLGIGLKGHWLWRDEWFGLWENSVKNLCPEIPTTY